MEFRTTELDSKYRHLEKKSTGCYASPRAAGSGVGSVADGLTVNQLAGSHGRAPSHAHHPWHSDWASH